MLLRVSIFFYKITVFSSRFLHFILNIFCCDFFSILKVLFCVCWQKKAQKLEDKDNLFVYSRWQKGKFNFFSFVTFFPLHIPSKSLLDLLSYHKEVLIDFLLQILI